MDKQTLRERMRQKKREMTREQIHTASLQLGELLFRHPYYQQASTIYGYLPINQEVRTEHMLLRAMEDGKRIALPKIVGQEMRFFYMENLDLAEKGYCGIPEPPEDAPPAMDSTALVLVPGLAFDSRGYRVGYGKGFYDAFLSREPGHPTLSLCYGFQMVAQVDECNFDVPVDYVLWA